MLEGVRGKGRRVVYGDRIDAAAPKVEPPNLVPQRVAPARREKGVLDRLYRPRGVGPAASGADTKWPATNW